MSHFAVGGVGIADSKGEATPQGGMEKKAVPAARRPGPVRLLRAERNQVLLIPTDLAALLPEDLIARGLWELVGKLELALV